MLLGFSVLGLDVPSFLFGGVAGCVAMLVPTVFAWVSREIGYLKADVAKLQAAAPAAKPAEAAVEAKK